jgi:hypothetical protein
MRNIVETKDVKIIIDCNEVINLFLHTLNIYGLLGNHGTSYKLKKNENVLKSIDKEILENVKQGDSYFSYGNLWLYIPGMEYIINNRVWENQIDQININMGITEMRFNLAFQKSWNEFYKDYWYNTLKERKLLFLECMNSFNFVEAAKKMTIAAHCEFPSDFYVFPAESLAGSGLKFSNNVCMGDLVIGSDMSFVHEGLHLLLNKKWAENKDINKIIKESNYKVEYYNSWMEKYEQALVIGLDCCIQNSSDERAKNYYENCDVDDVFNVAYPLIKNYYNNNCNESIEKLMFKIIKQTV